MGIAVFGLFGCGNLGNHGSLESMPSFLRDKRPGARLLCICKVPEVVTETFGIEPCLSGERGGHRTRSRPPSLEDPGQATRFHNVVAALIAGKPVVSLSNAAKNDLLLGRMGLDRFCQHIEGFDVELLTEQFSRLSEGRDEPDTPLSYAE
jgi:polysaccharide pyruvyl transferase WcaK-like protein